MFERQHRLEHAGNAGSGFGMADIGFDRADRQRPRTFCSENVADRARFGRVADARAGAVRLDKSEIVRANLGAIIDALEQRRLIGARGKRNPGRASVGIDVAAGDQGVNAIVGVARRIELA